jgi:uncharacterized integral membrane protein
VKARFVIGVLLLLIGLVWIFQGAGVLKGSFMTGEALWLIIGILVAVVGAGLILGVARQRRRLPDQS